MGIWWIAERRIMYDFIVNGKRGDAFGPLVDKRNHNGVLSRKVDFMLFEHVWGLPMEIYSFHVWATTSNVGGKKAMIRCRI